MNSVKNYRYHTLLPLININVKVFGVFYKIESRSPDAPKVTEMFERVQVVGPSASRRCL